MAQCLQQDDLDCWPKNSTEIPLEIDVIAAGKIEAESMVFKFYPHVVSRFF